MSTRPLLLLAAFLGLLPLAATAEAADYVPGEVVVGHEDGRVSTVATENGQSVGAGDLQAAQPPQGRLRRPQLRGSRRAVHAKRPLPAQAVELHRPYGIGMPEAWSMAEAAGAPGGPRRHRGGDRQRRGVREPRPVPARPRPAPLHVRPSLGLRRARRPPQRPLRPRHPRGGHDRPGHQQRLRRRRRRLRGQDHAAQGARRLRRGRLAEDRQGDPLRGQARRRRDQPVARVRPPRGRQRDPRDHLGRPLRAQPRRRDRRRRRQLQEALPAPRGLPRARQRRDRRRRHDPPRLPRPVLELRQRPRRGRAGRRRRLGAVDDAGAPALPTRDLRLVDLPGDLPRQQRARLRAAAAATTARRWRARTSPRSRRC